MQNCSRGTWMSSWSVICRNASPASSARNTPKPMTLTSQSGTLPTTLTSSSATLTTRTFLSATLMTRTLLSATLKSSKLVRVCGRRSVTSSPVARNARTIRRRKRRQRRRRRLLRLKRSLQLASYLCLQSKSNWKFVL
ncbi:uncharacterized protein LACBIDRAFT_293281, partial [Laccaria bicolor S238N-H82]